MLRLLLFGCFLLPAVVAGCAFGPPDLPELVVENRHPGNSSEEATALHSLGLPNPQVVYLRSPLTAQPDGVRLEGLTCLVPREQGWGLEAIVSFSRHLPLRLSDCGIGMGPVRVVFFDAPQGFTNGDFSRLATRVPDAFRPFFFFTRATGTDERGRTSGGYTRHDDDGRPYAVIARSSADGTPFDPEQTLAHELGHMAGLEHTPERNRYGEPLIDLMHPRGCLYCAFTEEQCNRIRKLALPR
jgi:hypothetical protein